MPQNTHIELSRAEAERLQQAAKQADDLRMVESKAEELATTLAWLPNEPSSTVFPDRSKVMGARLKSLLADLERLAPDRPQSDDLRWLCDNTRLLYAEIRSSSEDLKKRRKLPHVRDNKNQVVPRVLALAEEFL